MAEKPWAGRFTGGTDRRVEEFTESISFDRRLYEQDIRGSIAHARMLAHVGLLTDGERDAIVAGLAEIRDEIDSGKFPFVLEREDIHMHVEAALIDRLGDVGRKLHTARSRNDQVALDSRLWTRDALDRVDALLTDLQRSFVNAAERHEGVIIPGYTHMQRAQPVLAAHYFLAFVEKLARDRSRVADCRKRLNVLPLGAAAMAGTTLPIDREFVARELGFEGVAANSMDVSSDRDFAIESVFVLTMIAEHLSGWAEEWVIWSTQEFSFLALPDGVCTGSSIMPQKRNPDVCELIRGRCARVIGALTTLLVLVKGLPLAYNRDLQEDKEPLFDAFDTVIGCLELAAVVVDGATLRSDRINERLEEGFLDATTLMEYLIQKGVPQRSGHEIVGKLVGLCERRGCRLADLSAEDFAAASPAIGPDVAGSLGVANAVAAFRSFGSTAPDQVTAQLAAWQARLGSATDERRGTGVSPLLTRHGGLSHLEIPATDTRQSAAFYEQVLGWGLEMRGPDDTRFHDATGHLIGRWMTGRAISREPGLLAYYYVDHLDAAVERALAHGGEVVKAPYPEGNLWVATIRDPAGNVIGLWQAT